MNHTDCASGSCVPARTGGNTKVCQGAKEVGENCDDNGECASNSCAVDEDSGGHGSLKKCAGKYPLIVAVF